MGTSKSKPRSSDTGFVGQTQHAHLWLSKSAYRVATKLEALEAQRQLDARAAEKANPTPDGRHARCKYPLELVQEVKAMYAAGWPPREIRRVVDIPEHSLASILYNIADGMSAAAAKGRWKKPKTK